MTLAGYTRGALFGALAAGFCPLVANAQALATSQPLDLHLGRIVLVLVLCMGLALLAAVLLKRSANHRSAQGVGGASAARLGFAWLSRGQASSLAVLETRKLSLHGDVCRLSYQGREYLVVVTPGGATLLKEGEPAPEESP